MKFDFWIWNFQTISQRKISPPCTALEFSLWGTPVSDSDDSIQANDLYAAQLEGKECFATNTFQMRAQAFVGGRIPKFPFGLRSETWGKVICHLTHFHAVSPLILFVCFHSAMEKARNLRIFFLSLLGQIYWSHKLIHPKWDKVRAKLMKYGPLNKLMISDGIVQILYIIYIYKRYDM